MPDIDEIMNRARAVSAQASGALSQSMQESRKLTEQMQQRLAAAAETGTAEQEPTQHTDCAERQAEQLGQGTEFAQVHNYVVVDAINGKPATAFRMEYSKKRKGLLAPKVEILFLEPGQYEITAHGKTYQTTPAIVQAELEAGKYYCLGAAEDGLYLEERPYEWTL